jgi:5-methylcytosine-specific restriction endonuclease McrA
VEWTPARKKAFIISVLRSGTRRWPPKYETLNEAKTEKKINVKTGRLAQHYRCASCLEEFTASNIQVDHIIPVASIDGFSTWDSFIENLFCEKDNLQVLCVPCHAIKTKEERSENQSKSPRRRR